MKTEIIPDSEENLDELVVRARSDSELKRILRGEKLPVNYEWSQCVDAIASCMSMSPDDKVLAYVPAGGLLMKNIDLEKKDLTHFPFPCEKCDALDFYPFKVNTDGVRIVPETYMLAVALREELHLSFFSEDYKEWKQVYTGIGEDVKDLAFSKDGKYLAIAYPEQLRVFKFCNTSMTVREEIYSEDVVLKAVAFGDKKLFGAAANNVTIYGWHVQDNQTKKINSFQIPGNVTDIAVHENGLCVSTWNSPQEESHTGVYDMFSGRYLKEIGFGIKFAAGKKIGASSDENNMITVYEL
jgi:hypothetical protein